MSDIFEFINPMSETVYTEQAVKSEPVEDHHQKTEIDIHSKCGEIFALFGGDFILICGFCHDKHENIITFGIHIKEQHEHQFTDIVSYLKAKHELEDKISKGEDDNPIDSTNLLDISNEVTDNVNLPENVEAADTEKLNKSAKYVCDTCGQTYKQKGRLRNHQLKNKCRSNSPEVAKPVETFCIECNKNFSTSLQFKRHAQKAHKQANETNETVQPAEVEDPVSDALPEISSNSHTDEPSVVAKNEFPTIDEESTQDNYSSDDALDSKAELDEQGSDTCEETHDKSKNIKSPKKFPCDACDKVFRSKQAKTYHNNRCHNSEELNSQSHRCKYCNQEFSSRQECTDHEGTHIGEKRFICFYCPHTFRTNYGRKRHMRVHTGERPFKCTECPKAFPHMVQLDYHIRKHKNLKEYSCHTCGKAFFRKFELSLHERKHTGFRPLVCEDCGKTFNVMSELNEHRKRHTDRKDWKCEECGKCFYSKWTLKDHMAGHSGETPFGCDVCGRKFSRAKALKKHKKLHSDVKSYICNICGKAYAQDSGLYAHKKTHGIRNLSTDAYVNKNV